VRQAACALPAPKGVVYFDAPELLPKFTTKLARAVGYTPHTVDPLGALRPWLSGLPTQEADPKLKEEPLATWIKVKNALEEAAKVYRAEHVRPTTLVIDTADMVTKRDAAFFGRLQGFARNVRGRQDHDGRVYLERRHRPTVANRVIGQVARAQAVRGRRHPSHAC
jgi:hypothetical protein